MTNKHTPTPWIASKPEESNGYWYIDRKSPSHGKVAVCYNRRAEANAEFIVKAVNCHDELLEALESLVGLTEGGGNDHVTRACNDANRAIAKAKGLTNDKT